MKVIVEPRFPVRGILAGPISKPMRLELSPMQIKRCILSDAKVYEEMEGGKKREVTLGELPALSRKTLDTIKTSTESVVDTMAKDANNNEIPAVDKKEVQPQAPVDPYKGMTKAERRRARREAEQKAAEEAAKAVAPVEEKTPVTETEEEAPLEEVSAEQVIEEVNSTVEKVEQSVEEETAEEVVTEEEKVEE